MKYNILIISFLILIISINTAISNNNYIINDNTVYIDNPNVYLSANPHTLSSSGWAYFNLTSKVYTGNIDACWGFNTTASKPKKAEVYSPHWVNTTTNHEKIFYNSTYIVYTGDDLNYGNSYNTNYKYTITESIVNENGTTYITSNAAFDSFDTGGTNYTVYWHNRHDNYYLWRDFSSSFNSIIYDYKGYNKWYYIKNVPIASNKEYTVRAWINVPVSTEKQSGKYYFAIKPSDETMFQAVNNGHFYNLDPWWNATWSNRKNITLTGNTSGAQTDYQLLLNVTYEPEMQSDFADLRFCNETNKLDSWLESKVDGSYALVWVEFPTTPANGVNLTYYMYYGNVGATSNWDGVATFILFDDFETNLTKWTFVGLPALSTTQKQSGAKSVHFNHNANEEIQRTTEALSGKALSWYFYDGGDISNLWQMGGLVTQTKFIGIYTAHSTTHYVIYDSGYVTTIVARSNGWHKASIRTDTDIRLYIDDTLVRTIVGTTATGIRIGDWTSCSSINKYVDDLYVCKYAANPPTYAFGSSEEYYIPPTPTTLINETKLIMSEIMTELKDINMSNYLVYAFILIGILLIILGIQIITNNIYRG